MLILRLAFASLRSRLLTTALTVASIAFDANPPTVTVAAGYSKHRREDVVPLHAELVAGIAATADEG